MKHLVLKIKQSKIICLVFFFISVAANSQIATKSINESPYNVIYNHSYYLKEASYNPSKAALSLPRSVANKKETAIKLKKVLDGKGINTNFLKAPKNPNHIDSLSSRAIYYPYSLERRIYVEKVNKKWYYSQETINKLPHLYNEIYILDINPKKYFHSAFWYKEFLGISILKWIGLLLLFPICYITYFISKKLSYYSTNKYLNKKFKITNNVQYELKKSSKILGLFIAAKTFNILLPQLQLPVSWNAFLLRIVGIISILVLIALINKLIDAFFVYFKARATDSDENQLLPVINRILKTIVWIIGIIYIMQYLGINVVTILTGLSIGGLVVALAAQDTVKNLIGSVMIFIDKPFQINDWVQFNDIEGVVEEIGVRSTRIRTFEDSLIYVPNSILADNVVNNIGLRKNRRFKTFFNLQNNLPINKIDGFIAKLKNIIKNHPHTLKDRFEVCLHDMKDGLPSIMFYCFFSVDSSKEELKCRHELLSEILSLAEKEDINFAFPSKSVYLNSLKNGKAKL